MIALIESFTVGDQGRKKRQLSRSENMLNLACGGRVLRLDSPSVLSGALRFYARVSLRIKPVSSPDIKRINRVLLNERIRVLIGKFGDVVTSSKVFACSNPRGIPIDVLKARTRVDQYVPSSPCLTHP